MPAFLVVNIEVVDREKYEEYKKLVSPTLDLYDGRYLARGGAVEVLEGKWSPHRFVIIEFPSVERAKAWWNSPEYEGAKRIRQASARSELIVVQGL
jgi:uncharacterized protein (DUF1330 family)